MRGRAELLIPLSWMLFYRSCGVAACGRSPSSECARLLIWLLGQNRVREARREEATMGKARQCQALSLEKCPSLGQSFRFSHTCTWALLVPSHHLFMCFRVHHTVSKPSLYIAFIFSIPISGYMVGIQEMFVEEECLYDLCLLFSVQTNQIVQLTCKLFNIKFLCSYLMILLIILQIYTYTCLNMCVYVCISSQILMFFRKSD